MMQAGSSSPWPTVLKEMTGSDRLDAAPLLEYFAPLMEWLKNDNSQNDAALGWTYSKPKKYHFFLKSAATEQF